MVSGAVGGPEALRSLAWSWSPRQRADRKAWSPQCAPARPNRFICQSQSRDVSAHQSIYPSIILHFDAFRTKLQTRVHSSPVYFSMNIINQDPVVVYDSLLGVKFTDGEMHTLQVRRSPFERRISPQNPSLGRRIDHSPPQKLPVNSCLHLPTRSSQCSDFLSLEVSLVCYRI